MVKVAAVIPVPREMLEDFGFIGPHGRNDAESQRWRRLWHARPEAQEPHRAAFWFRYPPPWEASDPPAWQGPVDVHPFRRFVARG